jgi:hypothetical protein
MIRNVELLETTMQFINDHEDKHDQDVWFESQFSNEAISQNCETAACFAGWAVLLNGYEHVCNDVYDRSGVLLGDVCEVAADLLGLEEWEANRLFDGSNSRIMLARMVKDLVNGDELADCQDYIDE